MSVNKIVVTRCIFKNCTLTMKCWMGRKNDIQHRGGVIIHSCDHGDVWPPGTSPLNDQGNYSAFFVPPLQWRHNRRDGVSNQQPHDCVLNRLFRCRSKKTSELRVTGLCAGNSPVTGEFLAQMASNAENVSIWWRHHVQQRPGQFCGRTREAGHSPCVNIRGY